MSKKYSMYDMITILDFIDEAKDVMDFKTFIEVMKVYDRRLNEADRDFDDWAKKEGLTE